MIWPVVADIAFSIIIIMATLAGCVILIGCAQSFAKERWDWRRKDHEDGDS